MHPRARGTGSAADGTTETEQKIAAGVDPRETLLRRISGARDEQETCPVLELSAQ